MLLRGVPCDVTVIGNILGARVRHLRLYNVYRPWLLKCTCMSRPRSSSSSELLQRHNKFASPAENYNYNNNMYIVIYCQTYYNICFRRLNQIDETLMKWRVEKDPKYNLIFIYLLTNMKQSYNLLSYFLKRSIKICISYKIRALIILS